MLSRPIGAQSSGGPQNVYEKLSIDGAAVSSADVGIPPVKIANDVSN
jgi:hypothetical protein